MRKVRTSLVALAAFFFIGGGLFLFFSAPREVFFQMESASIESTATDNTSSIPGVVVSSSTLTVGSASQPEAPSVLGNSVTDLPNQEPLLNPPEIVKGIYVTSWVAGTNSLMNGLVNAAKQGGWNAMVVDIKDYSGNVAYRTTIPDVNKSGADREIRIARPNALIAELHKNNFYVIGRVTVFQDPILAKAHPEWALQNKTTGEAWKDHKGLSWMDPSAKGVWDYNIAIAKDAFARGFDEINFDYVRFASDGDLANISFPVWDQKSLKQTVIKNFFHYLRSNLEGNKISADLFGLTTVNRDDLGIGQVIEAAYPYFDYVSPMIYPSHYASGFLGYKNPGAYPYEVIHYSMQQAVDRLIAAAYPKQNTTSTATSTPAIPQSTPAVGAKLRPWIQVFDLGARYDRAMIEKELNAVYDVFLGATSTPKASEFYAGWLMWDPKNLYTDAKGIRF